NGTPTGGAPSLLSVSDFPVDLNPSGVAIFDFNGDGKPDVVTCNEGASNVTFYGNVTVPGANVPTMQRSQEVAVATGPTAIAVRDVNGDGRPDVIVSCAGGNVFTVLLNLTAPGSPGAVFTSRTDIQTGTSSTPTGVAVGDFDGDG